MSKVIMIAMVLVSMIFAGEWKKEFKVDKWTGDTAVYILYSGNDIPLIIAKDPLTGMISINCLEILENKKLHYRGDSTTIEINVDGVFFEIRAYIDIKDGEGSIIIVNRNELIMFDAILKKYSKIKIRLDDEYIHEVNCDGYLAANK